MRARSTDRSPDRNLDDGSRYVSPRLVWSASDNVELSIGALLFSGPPSTEYSRLRDLWYAQAQWFF